MTSYGVIFLLILGFLGIFSSVVRAQNTPISPPVVTGYDLVPAGTTTREIQITHSSVAPCEVVLVVTANTNNFEYAAYLGASGSDNQQAALAREIRASAQGTSPLSVFVLDSYYSSQGGPLDASISVNVTPGLTYRIYAVASKPGTLQFSPVVQVSMVVPSVPPVGSVLAPHVAIDLDETNIGNSVMTLTNLQNVSVTMQVVVADDSWINGMPSAQDVLNPSGVGLKGHFSVPVANAVSFLMNAYVDDDAFDYLKPCNVYVVAVLDPVNPVAFSQVTKLSFTPAYPAPTLRGSDLAASANRLEVDVLLHFENDHPVRTVPTLFWAITDTAFVGGVDVGSLIVNEAMKDRDAEVYSPGMLLAGSRAVSSTENVGGYRYRYPVALDDITAYVPLGSDYVFYALWSANGVLDRVLSETLSLQTVEAPIVRDLVVAMGNMHSPTIENPSATVLDAYWVLVDNPAAFAAQTAFMENPGDYLSNAIVNIASPVVAGGMTSIAAGGHFLVPNTDFPTSGTLGLCVIFAADTSSLASFSGTSRRVYSMPVKSALVFAAAPLVYDAGNTSTGVAQPAVSVDLTAGGALVATASNLHSNEVAIHWELCSTAYSTGSPTAESIMGANNAEPNHLGSGTSTAVQPGGTHEIMLGGLGNLLAYNTNYYLNVVATGIPDTMGMSAVTVLHNSAVLTEIQNIPYSPPAVEVEEIPLGVTAVTMRASNPNLADLQFQYGIAGGALGHQEIRDALNSISSPYQGEVMLTHTNLDICQRYILSSFLSSGSADSGVAQTAFSVPGLRAPNVSSFTFTANPGSTTLSGTLTNDNDKAVSFSLMLVDDSYEEPLNANGVLNRDKFYDEIFRGMGGITTSFNDIALGGGTQDFAIQIDNTLYQKLYVVAHRGASDESDSSGARYFSSVLSFFIPPQPQLMVPALPFSMHVFRNDLLVDVSGFDVSGVEDTLIHWVLSIDGTPLDAETVRDAAVSDDMLAVGTFLDEPFDRTALPLFDNGVSLENGRVYFLYATRSLPTGELSLVSQIEVPVQFSPPSVTLLDVPGVGEAVFNLTNTRDGAVAWIDCIIVPSATPVHVEDDGTFSAVGSLLDVSRLFPLSALGDAMTVVGTNFMTGVSYDMHVKFSINDPSSLRVYSDTTTFTFTQPDIATTAASPTPCPIMSPSVLQVRRAMDGVQTATIENNDAMPGTIFWALREVSATAPVINETMLADPLSFSDDVYVASGTAGVGASDANDGGDDTTTISLPRVITAGQYVLYALFVSNASHVSFFSTLPVVFEDPFDVNGGVPLALLSNQGADVLVDTRDTEDVMCRVYWTVRAASTPAPSVSDLLTLQYESFLTVQGRGTLDLLSREAGAYVLYVMYSKRSNGVLLQSEIAFLDVEVYDPFSINAGEPLYVLREATDGALAAVPVENHSGNTVQVFWSFRRPSAPAPTNLYEVQEVADGTDILASVGAVGLSIDILSTDTIDIPVNVPLGACVLYTIVVVNNFASVVSSLDVTILGAAPLVSVSDVTYTSDFSTASTFSMSVEVSNAESQSAYMYWGILPTSSPAPVSYVDITQNPDGVQYASLYSAPVLIDANAGNVSFTLDVSLLRAGDYQLHVALGFRDVDSGSVVGYSSLQSESFSVLLDTPSLTLRIANRSATISASSHYLSSFPGDAEAVWSLFEGVVSVPTSPQDFIDNFANAGSFSGIAGAAAGINLTGLILGSTYTLYAVVRDGTFLSGWATTTAESTLTAPILSLGTVEESAAHVSVVLPLTPSAGDVLTWVLCLAGATPPVTAGDIDAIINTPNVYAKYVSDGSIFVPDEDRIMLAGLLPGVSYTLYAYYTTSGVASVPAALPVQPLYALPVLSVASTATETAFVIDSTPSVQVSAAVVDALSAVWIAYPLGTLPSTFPSTAEALLLLTTDVDVAYSGTADYASSAPYAKGVLEDGSNQPALGEVFTVYVAWRSPCPHPDIATPSTPLYSSVATATVGALLANPTFDAPIFTSETSGSVAVNNDAAANTGDVRVVWILCSEDRDGTLIDPTPSDIFSLITADPAAGADVVTPNSGLSGVTISDGISLHGLTPLGQYDIFAFLSRRALDGTTTCSEVVSFNASYARTFAAPLPAYTPVISSLSGTAVRVMSPSSAPYAHPNAQVAWLVLHADHATPPQHAGELRAIIDSGSGVVESATYDPMLDYYAAFSDTFLAADMRFLCQAVWWQWRNMCSMPMR